MPSSECPDFFLGRPCVFSGRRAEFQVPGFDGHLDLSARLVNVGGLRLEEGLLSRSQSKLRAKPVTGKASLVGLLLASPK